MRIDSLKTATYGAAALIFSLILFCCNSCSTSTDTFDQAENGLLYTFREKANSSKKANPGDRVLVRVTYFAHDSLIFDSREISPRFIQEVLPQTDSTPSIFQAYMLMSEGDSITCKISARDFYSQISPNNFPNGISPNELLRFEIRLEKIFDANDFISEEERFIADLAEKEQFLLEEYIQSHYPEQKPTESGMYYIEEKKGSGKKPNFDSQVIIHYSISYLDGHILYSTANENDPLHFRVNDESVWPGLTEGVQYMREGGLAIFILPSELAAGKKGEDPIPPCKSIIVRIQLVKVL